MSEHCKPSATPPSYPVAATTPKPRSHRGRPHLHPKLRLRFLQGSIKIALGIVGNATLVLRLSLRVKPIDTVATHLYSDEEKISILIPSSQNLPSCSTTSNRVASSLAKGPLPPCPGTLSFPSTTALLNPTFKLDFAVRYHGCEHGRRP